MLLIICLVGYIFIALLVSEAVQRVRARRVSDGAEVDNHSIDSDYDV